jgi:hypothetical protein
MGYRGGRVIKQYYTSIAGRRLTGTDVDLLHNVKNLSPLTLNFGSEKPTLATQDILGTDRDVLLIDDTNNVAPEVPDFLAASGCVAFWTNVYKDETETGIIFSNKAGDGTEFSLSFTSEYKVVSVKVFNDTAVDFLLPEDFEWDNETSKPLGFVLQWNSSKFDLYICERSSDQWNLWLCTADTDLDLTTPDYDLMLGCDRDGDGQTSVGFFNLVSGYDSNTAEADVQNLLKALSRKFTDVRAMESAVEVPASAVFAVATNEDGTKYMRIRTSEEMILKTTGDCEIKLGSDGTFATSLTVEAGDTNRDIYFKTGAAGGAFVIPNKKKVTYLYLLNTGTSITGNITGMALTYLFLYNAGTSITGNITDMVLTYLYLYNTGTSIDVTETEAMTISNAFGIQLLGDTALLSGYSNILAKAANSTWTNATTRRFILNGADSHDDTDQGGFWGNFSDSEDYLPSDNAENLKTINDHIQDASTTKELVIKGCTLESPWTGFPDGFGDWWVL